MAVYTTEANVNNVLSAQGTLYRADDDLDSIAESGVVDYCIDFASRQVDFYLAGRYDTDDFATNEWVEKATTILAACILSARRGNDVPNSLAAECDQWKEMLEKARLGHADIPGLTPNATHPLLVSGMTVDLRYRDHPIRRSRARSTGPDPPSGVKNHPTEYIEEEFR